MLGLLIKIYHKLEHFAFIRRIGLLYHNGFFLTDMIAASRLKKCKHKIEKEKKNKTIRVGFICQSLSLFGKIKPIYEAMISDDRFEPVLIAVPDINVVNPDANNNPTYKELSDTYCNENIINSYTLNNDLYKIEGYDYIFFPRPYDQYLPRQYRSSILSKNVKCCYCDYSYNYLISIVNPVFSRYFFRNIYFYFSSSNPAKKLNINRFYKMHKHKYMHSMFLGYPILKSIYNSVMSYKEKHDRKHITILWTPRWTTEKSLGSTSFWDYKDKLLDFVEKNDRFKLVFRPHPLMFGNFIKKGLMNKNEINEYLNNYKNDRTGKLIYDVNNDYCKSFADSDILISDVSSMIYEYSVTSNPIIHIVDPIKVNLGDTLEKYCYHCSGWNEMEKFLDDISNGVDPLYDLRMKLTSKVIAENVSNVENRFLKAIADDYYGE